MLVSLNTTPQDFLEGQLLLGSSVLNFGLISSIERIFAHVGEALLHFRIQNRGKKGAPL